MAATFSTWSYKPASVLAWWAIGLISVVTACDVMTACTEVAAMAMYGDTWYDPAADPEGGELLLALVQVLGGLGMIVSYVAAVVVFCCWQYRVAANARALGAEGMQITPGWNVGWWFIPFANLVKPMWAMAENYNASLPDTSRGGPTPAIIGWWWAAWLIGNFLSQTSLRLSLRDDPALVEAGTWFGLASTAVALVTFVLVVRIIRNITAWQAQRAAGEGLAVSTRSCPRCGSHVPALPGAVCPGCMLPMA